MPPIPLIETQPGPDWRNLQQRVAAILQECGMQAEVEKTVEKARGKAEIDVYATDNSTTPPSIYVCECKLWTTSAVPQSAIEAFKSIVADIGAHFGIVISASGFQPGAIEVTEYTNIKLVDWSGFQEIFVERWCRKYWVPTFEAGSREIVRSVDPPVDSTAMVKKAHGQPLEEAEAVGLMAFAMWGAPFARFGEGVAFAPAIWKLRDKYRQYLPATIRDAPYLRDLLESLLRFAKQWATEAAPDKNS